MLGEGNAPILGELGFSGAEIAAIDARAQAVREEAFALPNLKPPAAGPD